jgi:D-alanyl-D-alanine carboxypeptidase/D-alanyl-D-alanine-endopeptidase (penicillin-binding protein 4)
MARKCPPLARPHGPIPRYARKCPPPLAEDVVKINKDSQNLHAQALFRRLGAPAASEQWASAMQRKLFEAAGIGPRGFEFWDGSGMSTYNRVSPRAGIALLRWASRQPWGAAWLASMPVAGRDGTLKRRFVGTPLEGGLAAKTGTLNATNALLGTFVTAKGRRFAFALFANDVPAGSSALPTMDAVLLKVAAAN